MFVFYTLSVGIVAACFGGIVTSLFFDNETEPNVIDFALSSKLGIIGSIPVILACLLTIGFLV